MKNSLIYKLYKRVNAKCKEKTGSTLLMVVMTMSVLIIIGSSFMVLSQNSALDGIFASSQVKAEQTALSVANVLKNGALTNLVNTYANELNERDKEKIINYTDSKLPGNTTITLKAAEVIAGAPTKVLVTVTTKVGNKSESLSFYSTSVSDSVKDVVGAVTNAFSVSGGGNYSFPSNSIKGDLSLDGDYLLALLDNNGIDGSGGKLEGSVFVDGNLVLGVKGKPTTITENLYVNGNLIINSCNIGGDVYVSGNILYNGVDSSAPVINGNVYCGGNFIISGTRFSQYDTEVNNIVGDGGATRSSGYKLKDPALAFSYFPTIEEMEERDTSLNELFGQLVEEISCDANAIHIKYASGKETTISRNLGNATGSTLKTSSSKMSGMGGNSELLGWYYGYDSKDGVDIGAYMVVSNSRLTAWSVGGAGVHYSTDTDNRLYHTFQQLQYTNSISGSEYIIAEFGFAVTAINAKISAASTGRSDLYKDCLPSTTTNSLTVAGNVYAQGDSYIEGTDTIATYNGKTFYTGGDFKFASAAMVKDVYGAEYNKAASDFTTQSGSTKLLYAGDVEILGNTRTADIYQELRNKGKLGSTENLFFTYLLGYGDTYGRDYGREKKGDDNTRVYRGYHTVNSDIGHYGNTSVGYTNYKEMRRGGGDSGYHSGLSGISNGMGKVYFKNANIVLNNVTMASEDVPDYNSVESSGTKDSVLNALPVSYTVADMYSEETLNLQDNALRDFERKQNPSNVAGVFREMGVYKVDVNDATMSNSTTGKNYDKAYLTGVFTEGTLLVNGNSYVAKFDQPVYYSGIIDAGNKLNNQQGINFTGVTSATQIKMGYTLVKALNTDIIITGGRGKDNAKNDSRILKRNQTPAKITTQNTMYDRMLYLGEYDSEGAYWDDFNNYSESYQGLAGSSQWEADMNEVLQILYNNIGTGSNWDGYIGAYCVDKEGKLRSYIIRDVYFNGGDWTLLDEFMIIDTSYGSVSVYVRPDNGRFIVGDNEGDDYSRLEVSVQFPQADKFNIAYIYLIPNFVKDGINYNTADTLTLAVANDILNNPQGYSYKTYKYDDIRYGSWYSNFLHFRTESTLRNTVKNVSGKNAIGFPFILGEASTLLRFDGSTELCGVVYTPNPDSEVYIGSEITMGTGSSGAQQSYIAGGAIVTGNINNGANHSQTNWDYIDNAGGPLSGQHLGDLLTDAIMDASGLGGIETSGGTNSTNHWQSGGFI